MVYPNAAHQVDMPVKAASAVFTVSVHMVLLLPLILDQMTVATQPKVHSLHIIRQLLHYPDLLQMLVQHIRTLEEVLSPLPLVLLMGKLPLEKMVLVLKMDRGNLLAPILDAIDRSRETSISVRIM
jgi:hypothetical protein